MVKEQSSADTDLRTYYKQQAAERGVEFVRSGMVVGLGTGSTSIFATRRIAQLLRDGELKDIVGFATSLAKIKEVKWMNFEKKIPRLLPQSFRVH